MKLFAISMVLILSLLLFGSVNAQEPELTPEPAPVDVVVTGDDSVLFDEAEDPVTQPDVPLAVFLQGGLTLVIVALLKKISLFDNIPAATLTTVVAIVLWSIFMVARAAGLEGQFNSISGALEVALPGIVELMLTLLSATAGFKLAQSSNTPLLGYSRTPARTVGSVASSSAREGVDTRW